jgi:urease accessory protein
MFAATDASPPAEPWEARLELGFGVSGGRTALVRRSHSGPLQVQRPFYPNANGACHVYVLHPPGGLVGGDRLSIHVDADEGAEALLTTPAATKFYRSNGPRAEQHVHIRVAPGASVEWLPQETIVFGGARGVSAVGVEVAAHGSFVGWELTCLGRRASGDRFEHGEYVQSLRVCVDGRPVAAERVSFEGGKSSLARRVGLAGHPVTGSLVAVTDRQELADVVRGVLPPATEGDAFSVTSRRSVLVCRYLGTSAMRARAGFERAWCAVQQALRGRSAAAPRIWAT